MWKAALAWLPSSIRSALTCVPPEWADRTEEIRIRMDRPLEIVAAEDYTFVTADGRPTLSANRAYRPTRDDCLKLLDRVTNHSMYSMEEELRRGYITVGGGHRIGIVGRAVLDSGRVRTLQQIGGFNVRIAREVRGAALKLVPLLWDPVRQRFHHTLIISPPQRGKTTLLRDAARVIAEGAWRGAERAKKVGIVDERSEIAACINGKPTFDVGARTDVLDACPKAEGMMMMIRSMSPEVLIVDELGREEDAQAVLEAAHTGITVIASAHGRHAEEVRSRPTFAPLFAQQLFTRIVILSPSGPTGQIAEVRDGALTRLPLAAAANFHAGARG